MNKLYKARPASFKALDDNDVGVFDALVAVFDNVDFGGDRIVKGAFTDTLDEWAASGDPIPVLWSHRSEDPDYHIGAVLEAHESDDGLLVRGQLDLEAPKAAQVWRLLKGRRVTQFSFAYDVLDGSFVSEGDEDIYELRKLKLFEVGPTLVGMNPSTELLGTKNLDVIMRRAHTHPDTIGARHVDLLRGHRKAIDEALALIDLSNASATPGPANAAATADVPSLAPSDVVLSVEARLSA